MKAKVLNARVSLKDLREVLLAVKGKNTKDAESYLKRVLEHKDFIPYKHYPHGHKHGIQAGYPEKAIKEILKLIRQLKANVKIIGGNENEIKIERFDLGRGEYPLVFSSRLVKSHRGKRSNICLYTRVTIQEKEPEKAKEETNNQEAQKV
ncbi:MAG: uL22 family ribosomal protein [Conexivisphaerales archaeon]